MNYLNFVVRPSPLPLMLKTSVATLIVQLRRIESSLSQLPSRIKAWLHPGVLFHGLLWILREAVTFSLKNVSVLARMIGVLIWWLGRFSGTLICRALRLLILPFQLVAAIRHLSLPLHPARGQFPAMVCVLAILGTSVITLSPTAEDYWSTQAYPAVAVIDQALIRYGISIGPDLEPEISSSRPMIAVVLGSILPDESEEEVSSLIDQKPGDDLSPEIVAVPKVAKLRDVTRPAGWSQNPEAGSNLANSRHVASVPKSMSSEAYEIRD